MQKQQAEPQDETLFRAFIMGAAIVGLGWAAFRYTEIPQLAIQKGIAWYESQAEILARPTPLNPSQQRPGLLPPFAQHGEPLGTSETGRASQRQTPATVVQPPEEARLVAFELPVAQRSVSNPATAADQRMAIEQQLAELGVVYSLLETFGREQRRYRFHCDATLAGSLDLTRSFEASGSDAVEVMRRVLREVEAWRGPVVPATW